jgi:hypothetical protein
MLVCSGESDSACRRDFLEGFNLSDCPEFDEWQSLQRKACGAGSDITKTSIMPPNRNGNQQAMRADGWE